MGVIKAVSVDVDVEAHSAPLAAEDVSTADASGLHHNIALRYNAIPLLTGGPSMEAEQLDAGESLDALVSSLVLGPEGNYRIYRSLYGDQTSTGDEIAPYSTSIDAAWLLLEQIREEGPYASRLIDEGTSCVVSVVTGGRGWTCHIGAWLDGELLSEAGSSDFSAPLAICRAAVKAARRLSTL